MEFFGCEFSFFLLPFICNCFDWLLVLVFWGNVFTFSFRRFMLILSELEVKIRIQRPQTFPEVKNHPIWSRFIQIELQVWWWLDSFHLLYSICLEAWRGRNMRLSNSFLSVVIYSCLFFIKGNCLDFVQFNSPFTDSPIMTDEHYI